MIPSDKEDTNAATLKRINKIKVLNLIRESPDGISRAEIAKRTGLSAPTVSRVVERLFADERLVVDIGIEISERGRPPNLIKFSGENNYVIGIDLGYNNIYAVLADLNAKILTEIKVPSRMELGAENVLERAGGVIQQLIERSDIDPYRIFGVGVAVGGLVDKRRNLLEYNPDFGWRDVDIIGALARATDLPVKFDNVTRAMALGEIWYGIGKRHKHFICLNVGHGIGGGIVIDGRPFFGSTGMTGEFGHMTLEPNSPRRCDCGNYGCLETLASGHGIADAAREGLSGGAVSSLAKAYENDPASLSAESVALAAQEGDAFAQEVFRKAAEYIGVGLASLVNIFDPEAIVIGGGVTRAGELLFEPVRRTVKTRALGRHAGRIEIVPATFGMQSAVMGAVALILNEVVNLRLDRRNAPSKPASAKK